MATVQESNYSDQSQQRIERSQELRALDNQQAARDNEARTKEAVEEDVRAQEESRAEARNRAENKGVNLDELA
ncbi:MAG: hypothetical protein C0602_03615 [Denitrovibrio sp.]|nr:MAG: hypothetical protein C0602_03615 [Denitrovibrio sp.]